MLLAAAAVGCVPAAPPPADPGLAHRRSTGWEATSPSDRREVRAFAREYLGALRGCATPRRTAGTLVGWAGGHGFALLAEGATLHPGSRWVTRVGEKDFAAFVMGRSPPEAGFDVVVVAMDSPRVDLKPRPAFAGSGVLLLDTHFHGEIDMREWLSHPLALHGHVVRAEGDPAEISLGTDPTDPVFVIPDLLPHLAARAQAERIIDGEGLDAVAASTQTGEGSPEERLARTLYSALETRYRIGPDAFEHGEWSLVPATPPSFLGVDEALVGGYGHGHAANLFAALHAIAAGVPRRTAVVIGVESGGSSGMRPVVPLVLGRILSATAGGSAPERTVRAALARSSALVAANVGGVVGRGFAVNPRRDDALPGYIRRILDAFDSAGAQIQISSDGGWESPAREIGVLDLDAMDVSIPIAGPGTPMPILSTLDLWSAYRAYAGFFGVAD